MSMKQLNKNWKADDSKLVVYPDISYHETRRLVGGCFSKLEPITRWLLEPFSSSEDEKLASCVMGVPIYDALRNGGTLVGTRDDNGQLESVIVLRVYNTTKEAGFWHEASEMMSFAGAAWNMYQDTGIADEFTMSKFKAERSKFENRAKKFGVELKEQHKQHGPEGPHWYILNVAVSPASRGKGIGRQIMTRLGQAADEESMSCYLETVGAGNIRFYQSMGYTIVTEFVLEDVEASSTLSGVAMMVRHPQCDGAAPKQ